ncbi:MULTISPECIES: hypothetical protein [Paenibacillus]|jgi:hypothetical protein|uniref:hypothetical protein n=1 Tax=Paenibacillus TaxID=44249 RepID=UPI0015E8DFC9|nr:hypothetical protein [Paenibacillus illinoisensis]
MQDTGEVKIRKKKTDQANRKLLALEQEIWMKLNKYGLCKRLCKESLILYDLIVVVALT